MKLAFRNLLYKREYKRALLSTTQATFPETLAAEFEQRAQALTRETWEMLVEGGLSLPSSNV